MSQENVEIVRTSFDALNRGDVDAALAAMAPDLVFDFSRAVGPEHGVFGRAEMPDFIGRIDEPWQSVHREAEEFISAGEHVVARITSYHRGRDGIAVQARVTFVWTLRNGAITRICMYQDHNEALEAVGLSE